MTPELRGISRMTNVSSPLEQLGQLTARAAEAERLRRRPWLAAAKWARGTFESNDRISHYGDGTVAANSSTFLSAAMAVLLVTGAASVLSPIGSDLAANAGVGKTGARSVAARVSDASAAAPGLTHEDTHLIVKETEPAAVSYDAADTVSPMLQVAAAYASASAVKGSRLEPTAVALTNANGAAPPLVSLTEYRVAPAPVASLYMAVLSGLPAGSRLSKGMQVGKGEWVLALDDLGSVEIAVPTSVKRVAVARVEIAGQDGVSLVRFPLVVDPEGRIDTETVASVAVMKNAGLPLRSIKVAAARLEPQPPQPVRAKPQAKSQQNQQKDAVAPAAPQQKRKTATVRPAAPIIKPTTTANIPIEPDADNLSAAPVATLIEGSAGLETFRTFSLLGATDRP
jgi:hypothetical protein